MKNFIVLFIAFFVACIITSCTKENTVTPAKTTKVVTADKSDVGQGD